MHSRNVNYCPVLCKKARARQEFLVMQVLTHFVQCLQSPSLVQDSVDGLGPEDTTYRRSSLAWECYKHEMSCQIQWISK